MKYRKKPVVVDAIQLKKTQISIREILEMMGQEVITKCDVASYKFYEYCNVIFDKGYMEIETLEGVMRANIGDYIIKGVNGEFYPCKPDIFEKTYEAVEKGKSSNTPECYKSNNSTYPLCKGIDEKQECHQCNLYEDMDESNFWDIK